MDWQREDLQLLIQQQREDLQLLIQHQREDRARLEEAIANLREKVHKVAVRTACLEGILISQGMLKLPSTVVQSVSAHAPREH